MGPSRAACDEPVREGFPVFFCVFVVLGWKRVGKAGRIDPQIRKTYGT